MQQVLFEIPGINLPIFGFGVMLFLAFVSCFILAVRWGPREGISSEVIQDMAIWLFIGGLIGARSAYLLLDPNGQRMVKGVGDFFIALPQIWRGGIVLYGSFVGGLLAYIIFYRVSLRKKNVSTLVLADLIAPLLALGLFFGRLGCFLNGCCYGQVATQDALQVHYPLSGAASEQLIKKGHQPAAGFILAGDGNLLAGSGPAVVSRVVPNSAAAKSGLKPGDIITELNGKKTPTLNQFYNAFRTELFQKKGGRDLTLTVQRAGQEQKLATCQPRTLGLHPTQIYESVSMGVLFLMLLSFHPLRKSDGQVMALMMIGYGIHRSFNEILRRDDRPEGFESYVSWVLAGLGVCLFVWLWFHPVINPRPAPDEVGKKEEKEKDSSDKQNGEGS